MRKISNKVVDAEAGSAPAEFGESKTSNDTGPGVVTDPSLLAPGSNRTTPKVKTSQAAVSTNQLANHNLACGNTYSFVNLPLPANGKFTVSAAEMIALLSKRTDDEIDAIVKQADNAELQGLQLALHARCWVGGCCWERRRRNSEMKKKQFKTIPLETWCKSVGLRSAKSAKLWAENFQTVLDTSAALKYVVAFAGIDLFLPRVAEALRIVNAELAGREPSTAELPILLAWLKERIKKKKDPPLPNEHKAAIVRPEPIPLNGDPYADEVLVEIPESEEEVHLYLAAAIKHLALFDPLLRTYISLPADATVEERAQKLFAFTNAHERELFGHAWSELCRQAAVREAQFQSGHKMVGGESAPSREGGCYA